MDVHDGYAHWLDWIGPIKWMPLACRACRMEAAKGSASELVAWANATVAAQLAQTGIARRDVCAGIGIPFASDLKSPTPGGLNLWFMGGDTDFL